LKRGIGLKKAAHDVNGRSTLSGRPSDYPDHLTVSATTTGWSFNDRP